MKPKIFSTTSYKGFQGRAHFDTQMSLFHGEVVGIRDVVTFQGSNKAEAEQAFRDSVDDYLNWCHESEEASQTPSSHF